MRASGWGLATESGHAEPRVPTNGSWKLEAKIDGRLGRPVGNWQRRADAPAVRPYQRRRKVGSPR
jgi:hypothetical protein